MSKYIYDLIAQGEHLHLDFKYEISDAKKIARTISAFANTAGGKLLVGVKDNGVVIGVPSDEEAYMIESAAHIYCKPAVKYRLVPWVVKGKVVLEVDVPESFEKPHRAPWKEDQWRAFVRSKDENFVADMVLMEVWRNQSKNEGVLLQYKEEEEKLFAFLSGKPESTLKEIQKACKISQFIVKKILAKMIGIDLVQIQIQENRSFFSLKDTIA